MSKQDDIKQITNMLIEKLHAEIDHFQKQALELSAAGKFDECAEVLKKQKEAIGALIAMCEAAKVLNVRG